MPLEEGSLVEFTTLTNEIPVVVEQKHANEVTFANDRLTSLAVIKQKLTSFHLNDVVKLVQFSDAQNVTEQFKTIISEYYQNLVKFDRTASNSQVFTAIEDIEPLYRVAKSLVEGRASDIAEADIAQITVVHTNSQILREYHQLRESSKQGNQEDSKMAHETLIRVQQKKMTPITLEEAHTLISEGKVPEGYNLPVDKFTLLVEAVQKNLSEVLTLGQKNDSSYSSIRKRVNFLK
jgi:hypothetical protein